MCLLCKSGKVGDYEITSYLQVGGTHGREGMGMASRCDNDSRNVIRWFKEGSGGQWKTGHALNHIRSALQQASKLQGMRDESDC